MFKKNTAVTGFPIGHFIQTADGAAKTTGTPTCKRLLDGTGAACANAASYNADAGVWEIDLADTDMNGDMVGLVFTLADCLPISYAIRTTTKLVNELNDIAAGALMGLADDAITAAKFDESTAFPLKSADTGATAVARTGADADTLETLSDQVDGISAANIKTALEADGSKLDHLWEMTEDDAGVRRFTANALEQGPTGIGTSTLSAQDVRDAMKLAPTAGAADTGSVDAHLDTILTDGVLLAATQGAVTFGQVKIDANVSSEGALHIVNAAEDGDGIFAGGGNAGMHNVGTDYGLKNYGFAAGVYNHGSLAGQSNNGANAVIGESAEVLAIKAVTDKLDTAVELDGAVYRFTENALEQAPDFSSAVDASSIATAVDSLLSFNHGAGSWEDIVGVGAFAFTYTLTSSVDATPIAGATVWVTSDEAGATVVASGTTDAFGQAIFYLDAGTYYFWRQLAGWDFDNPDIEIVGD